MASDGHTLLVSRSNGIKQREVAYVDQSGSDPSRQGRDILELYLWHGIQQCGPRQVSRSWLSNVHRASSRHADNQNEAFGALLRGNHWSTLVPVIVIPIVFDSDTDGLQ